MEIVIGSLNRPKNQAVHEVFTSAYQGEVMKFRSVAADSGVSAHPLSGQESLEGAVNRANHARLLLPDADFYIGIEGGLHEVDDRTYEHGWVAIANKAGQFATALSAGIEMRGKLLEAIQNGQELNQALGEQFGLRDTGSENGFFGVATDDLVGRQAVYEQAITVALAQFKHPEYFT